MRFSTFIFDDNLNQTKVCFSNLSSRNNRCLCLNVGVRVKFNLSNAQYQSIYISEICSSLSSSSNLDSLQSTSVSQEQHHESGMSRFKAKQKLTWEDIAFSWPQQPESCRSAGSQWPLFPPLDWPTALLCCGRRWGAWKNSPSFCWAAFGDFSLSQRSWESKQTEVGIVRWIVVCANWCTF